MSASLFLSRTTVRLLTAGAVQRLAAAIGLSGVLWLGFVWATAL
jgi:hypothetical protein